MKSLLIGAGGYRAKLLQVDGPDWGELTTLDIDPSCEPDVLHDLEDRPLPFADGTFDQIHAYEVLEHVGRQGDWRGFFEEFTEYHRILRPNGFLCGSTPPWNDLWAWADPGHTRILAPQTWSFLSQEEYRKQVGKTTMADYRSVYDADFKVVAADVTEHHGQRRHWFVLQALKSSDGG